MRAWVQGNMLARFRKHGGSQEERIHEKEQRNTLALNYERKKIKNNRGTPGSQNATN